MKTDEIRAIIRRKKLGQESSPGDFRLMLEDILQNFLTEKAGEINHQVDEAVKKAATDLGGKILGEVKAHVMGKMPTPRDGHTPGPDELTRLIGPMIPKVRNGKDANEKAIVARVLRSLPKVKDGRTPTAEDILKASKPALKALGEEWDAKLRQGIKVLRSASQNRKQGSKSGGGMGNWTHQSFSIGSAATAVTLSARVAAAGSAILVRYQGQLLAHGVQYTAPGLTKVVALLFTPEDNTTLDVTYVRT